MGKLSERDKWGICELYKEGLSTYEIASFLGVSATTIGRVLKESKIKMRKYTSKYTYNPYAFDKLTPECAYWLGILLTDGCINKFKNSYRLILTLEKTDKNHLEKFKTFLKSNHKLLLEKARKSYPKYTSKLQYRIQIYLREHTMKKLKEYKMVPQKTLIVDPPDYLFGSRDFLRGCIDGDGCLGICSTRNIPYIGFASGSKRFIEKMNKKFNQITNSNTKISKQQGNTYVIKYDRKKAYKIIQFVYENAPDHIVLSRKKEIAEEIFKRFKDKYDN